MYLAKPPPVLTKDAGIELRLAVKAVEKDGSIQFEECDYDDPGAFARGRADIMIISDDTTSAIFYDHKTQPNIEEADTFQLGFYAWVISKFYPFLEEIQTVLHFARYGVYSDAYTWTKEDLAKIEDEIITRIMIIENMSEWAPTPHGKCQYCPMITECPVLAEFVSVDPETGTMVSAKPSDYKILGNTYKAVKIAGLLNVLEEATKIAKKELREHIKYTSPIAIPGKVYEYRASQGINWDKVNKTMRGKVYEVFDKHKVDPKLFMSFNQTASKTIWMAENELLIKELSDILPRKSETKFGGYKG